MKHHELKTDPEVFQMSWEGKKDYEIRLNDRDFQPGDSCLLRETKYSGEEMAAGKPLEYTDRAMECMINGVLGGYGLDDGWVILNIGYQRGLTGNRISDHTRWSEVGQQRQKSQQISELITHCSNLQQQSELWIQEARSNSDTVHEIYTLIGLHKGPCNGAEPVREYIDQQAARIAELEEQIKSRVVCDGYPTFYISTDGMACTHRMSEEDTPVWCRSSNDGMAAMSAIQPPADALVMSESKADDYLRLAQKLRAGLQEIYTMRGEDELIDSVCNPLLNESAP